ncbi:response regulator transcription factor [Nocardioides sp. WV_118_6]|uniref:response regulator transcription factor n=1 Tax=Nocardioides simplex TaxID=2045 RepID=UPI00214FA146|nr:response regulator transcription factor [Pimelobacter simplex]UUW89723.1 response regulator transcription factor [Pimelobacter simplex]UUW93552.1 response regulator transcription factor [Pimelobacter simplex]
MPNRPRVLLVEDDADLQVTTRLVLERHGFDVQVVGDGLEALDIIRTAELDLALVDIMLPGIDGIRLTRRARELRDLPIVMLTARDLPHDQVHGLEAGADDYVVKPFDGEVLVARLRAVLRRSQAAATTTADPDVLVRGDLRIDVPGMTVTRAGEPVPLSATEFRLLHAFASHPGVVLSRYQLLDLVWGDTEWTEERVVDVTLQRLRTKVGAERIETVRGAGYKMPRDA